MSNYIPVEMSELCSTWNVCISSLYSASWAADMILQKGNSRIENVLATGYRYQCLQGSSSLPEVLYSVEYNTAIMDLRPVQSSSHGCRYKRCLHDHIILSKIVAWDTTYHVRANGAIGWTSGPYMGCAALRSTHTYQ